MNLFSTLAEYKFAVINTGYRNATLLDITLFKNYDETYTLMRKFRDLTKQEVRIMDYLMKMDVFEGTYSELAKAIGDEKLCSNVRKALLHLQSMGIVNIVNVYYEDEAKDHKSNPMKACFIVDGWMYAFLMGGWDKVEFGTRAWD